MEQQVKTVDRASPYRHQYTSQEDVKDEEEEGKHAEEEDGKYRFVIQNRTAFNGTAR